MNAPLDPKANSLLSKLGPLGALLRQWEGPLTRELLLNPAGFGLGKVPDRLKPDATTKMVCGYCSTGCSLNIHLKDGQAVGLTPATDYPVNLGMACPKGWEALAVLDAPDRATTPLLRNAAGEMESISWDVALKTFCERFKGIQDQHGKDSIAWIGTGQIPTEELALLGAVGKFGMGMVHGDGNTRQCMATAVTAYKQSFGFDAPPFTYADFEESDAIVLVGSNLCIAHPIMWERVLRNKKSPEIVVIDPRKTETACAATLHLQIKPKSDLALFYGVAHMLIARGWIDEEFIRAHTSDFDGFVAHVETFTPNAVCETTGLSREQFDRFVNIVHERKAVSFWWTMGVNQSYEGVRVAQSLINLALMTRNIGRPGTGANSITGQCNAMGSRLFSNTTNLLGGRDFTKEKDRQDVAKILDIPVERIPDRSSWAYNEIMDGIDSGRIKGLWVIATNTAHSWINQNSVAELRKKLDFLVVQDMYASTETALMADLMLPAAAWGEKEGTFINSERRIGVTKKVSKAPGQALTDFNIVKLISHYWGCGEMFKRWESPEATFQIMKDLSKGQPCDITGIQDYKMIDDSGGVQWPCSVPELAKDQQRRLFADGQFFTPTKRAKFIYEAPRSMPESPSAEYPFLLLTGRGTASQWHTQTRTKKSKILQKLYPAHVYIEINPIDAERLSISANTDVTIASARGSITAKAVVTALIQPGQVFLPMHYEMVNQLTHPSFDTYSKQPNYKCCAVQISPA